MVYDVCGREVALETLTGCHAETATHAASNLATDTKCASVAIGNENGLDALAVEGGKEVLYGAVHAALAIHRFLATDAVVCLQELSVFQRDVRHLIDALRSLLVEPIGYLSTYKSGHTQQLRHLAKFIYIHAQKGL